VKKEIRNKRMTDEEFFLQRKEVMAMRPNGRKVDLDAAIEFHKSLPPSKNHALKVQKAKEEGVTSFCSMMGTAPLDRDIECSRYLQDEGHSDFLSTIVDSMTRNRFFEVAERELKESERTGRPLLNGLPVVHYGVSGARKKIEAVHLPVMLWGPAPDTRLVDEIGLAGGHTGASHGGAMCAFFHYTKDLPLEVCIRNFQYIYRLFGYYEERGIPIQHVAQGGLSCITPPSLLFAPQIIDHLLAAEQGVKNIQFCYWGAQGSLAQAVGSILALRKLGEEYLNRFGYHQVLTSMKAGYATNIAFPLDYALAFAVVCMAPIVTHLSRSEVCYITTVDEAHKIPSMENNAASLRSARMMLNLLKDQQSDFADSSAVKIEAEMVEKETRAILDRVVDLGEGDVALGAVRAVEAGVLDQPFAASQRTARRVMGVRDAEGSVRYLSCGNLPFTKEIMDFHSEKVAEREKAQGRKVDYDAVVSDIVAISRGSLLLDRDWQEKELSAIGVKGFDLGKGLSQGAR
jgi:methylaspartate mutase epsilon subunit